MRSDLSVVNDLSLCIIIPTPPLASEERCVDIQQQNYSERVMVMLSISCFRDFCPTSLPKMDSELHSTTFYDRIHFIFDRTTSSGAFL